MLPSVENYRDGMKGRRPRSATCSKQKFAHVKRDFPVVGAWKGKQKIVLETNRMQKLQRGADHKDASAL